MKTNRILLGIITVIATSILSISPALALPPAYDLTGTWTFNDIWLGTPYVHTMMINSFNPVTGAFSGVGYYTGDPSLTWTIAGTEDGTTINYVLTVLTVAPGVTLTGTGSLSSGTYMSGTGFQSNVGNVEWTAVKGNQVLNVMYKVTNDEDSGNVGYWALDNYNKQVQVWQDPNAATNFYVIAKYEGKWQTFADAKSPGDGLLESKDASGTMQGGYFASFTATSFNPDDLQAFGRIADRNYGGTESDVLRGTYGNGQTGPLTVWSVLGTYFPGYTNFNYFNWGWTYHYKSQAWNNFDTGTTRDIVV